MDLRERQGSEARRPPCDVGSFLAESGGALGAGDFRQVPGPDFCERRAASIGGDAPLAGFGFEVLKCGLGGRDRRLNNDDYFSRWGRIIVVEQSSRLPDCGRYPGRVWRGRWLKIGHRRPRLSSRERERANARLASIEDLFVTCCAGFARGVFGLGTASFRFVPFHCPLP